MVRSLERGEIPDEAGLRGWFRIALTKKLAVISLPPAFWESDPKRNPDSRHLLWASALLRDIEGFQSTQAVMAVEKAELNLSQCVEDRVRHSLEDLIHLVAGSPVEDDVRARVAFLLHNS